MVYLSRTTVISEEEFGGYNRYEMADSYYNNGARLNQWATRSFVVSSVVDYGKAC
jgi:hypothetical protein